MKVKTSLELQSLNLEQLTIIIDQHYISTKSLQIIDILHFISKIYIIQCVTIPWARDGVKTKSQVQNDRLAHQNFSQIKKNQFIEPSEVKVIGIQLKASTSEKEIGTTELHRVINALLDIPQYVPVLLVAPTEDETAYAEELNNHFGNSLVSIEFDFKAAPSVLNNLDLLVTPDTSIKQLGDILGIPMIEVSQGPSPFLKQGLTGVGNFILTRVASSRDFSVNLNTKEDKISGDDIFQSIRIALGHAQSSEIHLGQNITLYKCDSNSGKIEYTPICGDVDYWYELSRYTSFIFSMNYIYGEVIDTIPGYFESFPRKNLKKVGRSPKEDDHVNDERDSQ